MKISVNIFVVFIVIMLVSSGYSTTTQLSTNNNTDTDTEYFYKLQSEDIQTRIGALMDLNNKLKKKETELSENLKKLCYKLIDEEMTGKSIIDKSTDEEGQYGSEIFILACNINDEKVLPYLIHNTGLGNLAIKAILSHGHSVLNEIYKLADNYDNLSGMQKEGLINLFTEMIRPKLKGYVAKKDTRKNIKKKVLEITNKIQDQIKTNQKYQKGNNYKLKHIRIAILNFFSVLGDVDIISIVEDIAKNDAYFESIPKKYLKYREMSPSERRKHRNELNKISEERRALRKADSNAFISEEKVRYYPVREKAKKVLEELKQRHGM